MGHQTFRLLFVVSLCVAAAGCDSPTAVERTTDTGNIPDGDAVASDGFTTGTWCGAAVVGPEEESFRPCGTTERCWLATGPIFGGQGGCDYWFRACPSYACVTGILSPAKAIPHTGYGT